MYFVKANVDRGVLYYSSANNCYLLLNERLDQIFENKDVKYIEEKAPNLLEQLIKGGFIIDQETDELKSAHFSRMLSRMDRRQYHITVNTTLGCNLNCWYCHENKKQETKLTANVIDLIKKNIVSAYNDIPYKKLKISFFGGEPLLRKKDIKTLIDFSDDFCKSNQVQLILDFTTNGTLISKSFLEYLKNYKVLFQITLDGHQVKHDSIRKTKNSKGTYLTIISNIKKNLNTIVDPYVWIRFNYDEKSIYDIPYILNDVDEFDRKKCSFIIRRVWQVDKSKIPKETILSTLLQIINRDFLVDYYTLPHNIPCFAERLNQALFNYDGKVFKCSTREDFDDKNAEGKLLENGTIKWDFNRLAKKLTFYGDETCYKCKLYPACFGRCSEKYIQNEKSFKCILNNLNLTMEELVLFNFRLNQLHQKLYT